MSDCQQLLKNQLKEIKKNPNKTEISYLKITLLISNLSNLYLACFEKLQKTINSKTKLLTKSCVTKECFDCTMLDGNIVLQTSREYNCAK